MIMPNLADMKAQGQPGIERLLRAAEQQPAKVKVLSIWFSIARFDWFEINGRT
jgi:hypothetical protein